MNKTVRIAGAMRRLHALVLMLGVSGMLTACSERPWNNPYPPEEVNSNTLYGSFHERPKHLDPVRAYSSNEYAFIANIYEPPLQYHFLKRPYELIPLTLTDLPRPVYVDAQGGQLPPDTPAGTIAYSIYELHIKPGIMYQPHPAFARDAAGELIYHRLSNVDLEQRYTIGDFQETGTRELVADDYVYQIKRLAHPGLHSPIAGLMRDYIVGFKEYAALLESQLSARDAETQQNGNYLDLTQYSMAGVEVVDRYTYRIKVHGKYPQFIYWLSMPFFAPMAPEVERFYAQPGMAEKNLSLNWYPVGTGAYMLTINNPNRQMVMQRNPNYHGELYPGEGEPDDAEAGLLADAGKPLPFIEKAVYSLEKEDIPYWNKFLQGYYDASGINSDSFDQAIRISSQGEVNLTEAMHKQGIRLKTAVQTSTFYLGFNMLDSVIGGLGERARKLRQAISIALDQEEYISIFMNGRGIPAQGIIPPGIFGHVEGEAGINPNVYEWAQGAPRRKPLAAAQRLLAEAGYPDGIDQQTGAPLTLNLDVTASGPDDKSRLDWYRKQFQKLNIQLVIRNTDYNRFQEKMMKGNAQIFMWGWNADYPDPENFMFLLYGPSGKVKHHGENAANYANPEFDRLFEQMKAMDNGPERQALIDKMTEIARHDAPWIWGVHPKGFSLYHAWLMNTKPNLMANNTLKYLRIDPALRVARQQDWNQPLLWPVGLITGLLIICTLPAIIVYRRRERLAPNQPDDARTIRP